MKPGETPKKKTLSDFLCRKINPLPQKQQQASLALNTSIVF